KTPFLAANSLADFVEPLEPLEHARKNHQPQ
ncbi:MAG: hypothetical protein ACI9RZ_002457, partial [Sphingobacteriales bacterium]